MINYSDIRRYDNMPFDEYLKLPGYSHSFLKRERNGITEELKMTDNILLGSLVDSLLTDLTKVNMSSTLYPAARRIAATLKQQFGDMINCFKKQVSYTGQMECAGFRMPVTGRLDFLLESYAVIDLKVTQSKDMSSLIQFMGHENQVWNYAKLAQVPKAFLMIYSVPMDKTFIIQLNCSNQENEFWKEKILKFGLVNEAA